jgi:hypothetical protein
MLMNFWEILALIGVGLFVVIVLSTVAVTFLILNRISKED